MESKDQRALRKAEWRAATLAKESSKMIHAKVREIVKKGGDITEEEKMYLDEHPEEAKAAALAVSKSATRTERLQEEEDSPEVLAAKLDTLVEAIRGAKHLIFYTGAGISTAANIPDYRGPQGIWTVLEKASKRSPVSIPKVDLAACKPTLAHMCIAALVSAGTVRHVVSQNCDGLHLRSGIPRDHLSELHGNSFIEYCPGCVPPREFIRPYDVSTQSKPRHHSTGRTCDECGSPLKDSIVHFGEKGADLAAINWAGALSNVAVADVIVCLGSSLKILKKYPLWGADRPAAARPKLVIVNLQWTPKDRVADLVIRARADQVLAHITEKLGIPVPPYDPTHDPIATAPPGEAGAEPQQGGGWYGRGLKRKKTS